jgi:hypothetical protein
MADSRTLGAWRSLDIAELRRELERSDDRRIEARAGSVDHWQAIRDIHVLTTLLRARLGRAVAVPAANRRRRGAAPVRPMSTSSASCSIQGCSAIVGPDRPKAGPLADLCDVHILELTSAPDR